MWTAAAYVPIIERKAISMPTSLHWSSSRNYPPLLTVLWGGSVASTHGKMGVCGQYVPQFKKTISLYCISLHHNWPLPIVMWE